MVPTRNIAIAWTDEAFPITKKLVIKLLVSFSCAVHYFLFRFVRNCQCYFICFLFEVS